MGSYFAGCEEEPPAVRFTDPEKPLLDTTYMGIAPAPAPKAVFLVDITGVRCNNCPEAAITAKNIADNNPGRVTVLALFPELKPDVLTRPWDGYDTLVSKDAESLISTLGSLTSLPTGTIDQVKANGSYFIPHTQWASELAKRLSDSSFLNIDLNARWVAAENKSRLEIKLAYHAAALNKTHLLYVAVAENKIQGKQSNKDTAGGIQYGYTFNHVMRKLISSTTGDTLKAALTPGRVFERHYYIKPRYNWKPDNLLATVWVVDAATRRVLQSAEVHLK